MHVLVAFVPSKLHALSDDRTDIHGTVLNGAVIFLPFYIHAPASFRAGVILLYIMPSFQTADKVYDIIVNFGKRY